MIVGENIMRKLIKLSIIAVMLLLCYYVALPDIWTRTFWKNYYSKSIYIPNTKETLYLIRYQSKWDEETIRGEVSTCDWRCYFSEEREYWYHRPYDNNAFMYYKVSNDTLYLLLAGAIPRPPKFKAKTKIVQTEFRHFTVPGHCKGTLTYSRGTQEEDSILKSIGYERF